MRFKRRLSLYYGSITLASALRSMLFFINKPFQQTKAARKELDNVIGRVYGTNESSVFSFGSARSSLGAILKAAGIGKGDEVLISSYTCLAVPTGILFAGATPVYADIDPLTLNITTATVEAALTQKVRAIVVQHTLGKTAPVADIIAMAKSKRILVIEDCALSIGTSCNGTLAGKTADAAIFSMELSKTITCGWGGILLVNDRQLATATEKYYETVAEQPVGASAKDLLQTILSTFAHHPNVFDLFGKYILHFGFKFKLFRRSTPASEYNGLTEQDFLHKMGKFQLALARHQWNKFIKIGTACTNNATELFAVLKEEGFVVPGYPSYSETLVAPRVSFLVGDVLAAEKYFNKQNIELGRWFNGPLSPLPSSSLFNYNVTHFPNASLVAKHIVNLPCHSGLTQRDLNKMKQLLRSFSREYPAQKNINTSKPVI